MSVLLFQGCSDSLGAELDKSGGKKHIIECFFDEELKKLQHLNTVTPEVITEGLWKDVTCTVHGNNYRL